MHVAQARVNWRSQAIASVFHGEAGHEFAFFKPRLSMYQHVRRAGYTAFNHVQFCTQTLVEATQSQKANETTLGKVHSKVMWMKGACIQVIDLNANCSCCHTSF